MAHTSMLALPASIAVALLIQFFYRLYVHRRWFNGLPQPPHSFLFGHLKVMGEFDSKMPPHMHPQGHLTAIKQKYDLKGVFYVDIWPIAPAMVVITEPDLMDYINITKPLPMHKLADDFLTPVIGTNLVSTANGPVWKRLHTAMAPSMKASHVRTLIGMMADECMHFRDALDRHTKLGDVFSMEETAAKLVFDIVGKIVFNFELHAQTKGSSYLDDLRKLVDLLEAQMSLNPFVWLKSKIKKQFIVNRLDPSIEAKIRERLRLLRQEKIVPSRQHPLSVLDLMLREELAQDGPDIQDKEIDDIDTEYLKLLVTNVKGLLLGGHGTTTDTLCYIYMLLSKSPDVVQKLREEHTRIFNKDFATTLEMLQDEPQRLGELEYTDAVIKETLRLFPVGYGVRVAEENATINYNGQNYPIGNGLVVVNLGHAMHYDSNYYSEPAKFKPERFLDPNNPIPRSYFRTFGRGSRACLGQVLAVDELKVILLMTIRDYELECAGLMPNKTPKSTYTDMDTVFGDIIFQELGIEAKPRGGMMMTAKRIVRD